MCTASGLALLYPATCGPAWTGLQIQVVFYCSIQPYGPAKLTGEDGSPPGEGGGKISHGLLKDDQGSRDIDNFQIV